jgi:hypothetical protein
MEDMRQTNKRMLWLSLYLILISIIQTLILNTSMRFCLFSRDPKYENVSDRDPEKEFIIRSFLKTEKNYTYRATYNSEPFRQQCL